MAAGHHSGGQEQPERHAKDQGNDEAEPADRQGRIAHAAQQAQVELSLR